MALGRYRITEGSEEIQMRKVAAWLFGYMGPRKKAFAEMDKNEDGKVTEEEFISACLGQEEISRLLALKIIDIFCEEETK